MPEPAESGHLLGRTLPLTIGAYDVVRLLSDNYSYADYAARHRTLGHELLFRHERWPSPLSVRGSASADAMMDRATELHALDGLRRARRLQAERHYPRLVPVVDFFESDGEWFSVFAQVFGAQSLHEIIVAIRQNKRPPCSIPEFVALSAGVTDCLAAIHRAGFVHRTLGVHNIMVDDRDYVRLSDMGCATPTGADDDAARAFRSFMRPSSAAPEQFVFAGRSRRQPTSGPWESHCSSFATADIPSGRRRRPPSLTSRRQLPKALRRFRKSTMMLPSSCCSRAEAPS